jgi:hypothetical protein
MKMVKSLLLGTAAGLVAMSGAQAADLPVKAKPVQYVKICSLYGAGFYYIPGTDMCLKIGGWARVYDAWGTNGNSTNGALASGQNSTRSTTNLDPKVRGYITADARNQTEYGTVRSYIALGYNNGGTQSGIQAGNQTTTGTNLALSAADTGTAGFNANRAFIQFAGFTFGLTQSFFDFYSQSATAYWGGMINPASDTGDPGQFVYGAYTAQFGNGLSATLAAEQPRTTAVLNGGLGVGSTIFIVAAPGSTPTTQAGNLGIQPASSAEANQWPDIVANLRVDQAWGSAQLMGAIHDVAATYYGAADNTGHPSDEIGWAVGAGIKLLAPMIGQGDYFQAQVNYTQGARKYVDFSYNNMYSLFNGGTYGIGIGSDGVYAGTTPATGTSIELTTAWGVNAAYEHFWSKMWQTSVYGAYTATTYNANANGYLCAAETLGGGAVFGPAFGNPHGVACDNNFNVWTVGTRTQFNIDASTYLGLDVVYQKLETGLAGMTALYGNGAETATTKPRDVTDQSAWMVEFRVHRNFYP